MRNKNKAVATVLLYVFSLDTTVLAQSRQTVALASATARVVPAEAIPLPRAHAWPVPMSPQAVAPVGAPLQLPLAAPAQVESQATVTAASPVAGTPHDLNAWSREGDPAAGSWMVSLDGGSVVQLQRGDPSFFVSSGPEINTTLRGKLRVDAAAAGDAGFVGFVLGYGAPLAESGDEPNAADFVLLDWKGHTDTRGAFTAQEGLTLSRVQGTVADPVATFWGHTGAPVTVLGSRYGAGRGWTAGGDHSFEISYRRTRIRVSIDGTPAFDVTGSFPAGRFGFFTYGQGQVTFTG